MQRNGVGAFRRYHVRNKACAVAALFGDARWSLRGHNSFAATACQGLLHVQLFFKVPWYVFVNDADAPLAKALQVRPLAFRAAALLLWHGVEKFAARELSLLLCPLPPLF